MYTILYSSVLILVSSESFSYLEVCFFGCKIVLEGFSVNEKGPLSENLRKFYLEQPYPVGFFMHHERSMSLTFGIFRYLNQSGVTMFLYTSRSSCTMYIYLSFQLYLALTMEMHGEQFGMSHLIL